jgi:Beta-propeller repeat
MPSRNLLMLGVAAGLLPAAASRLETAAAWARPAEPALALEAYGKLPLSFERNQGQADSRVKYLSRGGGYSLLLTPSEAILSLRGSRSMNREAPRQGPEAPGDGRPAVVRMTLVGGNPAPEVSGAEELPGRSHYFTGNDPRRWRRDVPHFARVSCRDVYPGVDLVYHGRQGRLEYDFVVSPGSDPRTIRVRLEGAEAMRLDDGGNLVLETSAGRLVQQAPLVYQEIDGKRRRVSASHVLHGGGDVGFALGPYDADRPLVIDPVLEYSTYLGGSAGDGGMAIAVDDFGSAYVTGHTGSADFPVAGSYQQDQAGTDVFVTKLSPSGSGIVYSTYLGGGGEDFGTGIAVDAAGNAWVTGRTSSTDFPTVTPYQADRGGMDAFVTKLTPSGSSLEYSTYLGGRSEDAATSIAVDAVGSAYVAGYTSSDDFPTVHPYQTRQRGEDAFVTKVSPSGTSLSYSTYLGGATNERVLGIAVDDSGGAVVTGYTCSPDFPVLDPLQPHMPVWDAFVTRFSPSGSSLVYSTFLGGDGTDVGKDVAFDGAGNAYVTGYTDSTDFPTLHAYQAHQGSRDAFLSKVSPSGSSLVYSTYLGGGSDDVAYGVAVDPSGSAYLAGATKSTDFPTRDPLQTDRADWDAFVTKFAPSGSSLAYSTYLGGGGSDRGFGIAVDGSGSAYVVGDTGSTNFPTQHPYQTNQPGRDAFVSKLAATTSLGFFTVTPCRLVDTRLAIPRQGGPALACSPTPLPRAFPVAGVCDIPATAHSIAGNVTVTESTAAGQLRFFPAGTLPPLATTIHYTADLNRANNGILLLGAGHLDVTCHQPSGTAHVVIDVSGYFAETPEP